MEAPRNKVLLVEDDPAIVRMYQRKLDKEGFSVTTAYNGQEGLEVLKEAKPDIILLDIMMPKMNGIDMIKKVKADASFRDIPVVMMTNLGDRPEDVKACKELGSEDYWVKVGISLDEAVERIRKILEKPLQC